MTEAVKEHSCQALQTLFRKFPHINTGIPDAHAELIDVYRTSIGFYEHTIWKDGSPGSSQLELYQQLFHELEALLESCEKDNRHSFVVIIPVADRPRHLQSCLQSLYELCSLYHYGSIRDGVYQKIRVIIADDSEQESNMQQHRKLAEGFTKLGLETEYFGLEEQTLVLASLETGQRDSLSAIIGLETSRSVAHKGASLMRNITYLKLLDIVDEQPKTLFYFVDSDQEFNVKVNDGNQDEKLAAVNYFYYLDQLFSQQQITVFTGKVVGDPPVSPAVMAGNFLDDVIGFLHRIKTHSIEESCCFHQQLQAVEHDAAYHDMADLFGFKAHIKAYDYHCPLDGPHALQETFSAFASQLQNFFYGEHPTRVTYYQYQAIDESIQPARTIYTGNYIFNAGGLKYFIPFAQLKLRMAGPVLGRIIRSELGDGFVSANLPMLHKRTVEQSGQSEFRPGVNQNDDRVNLSGEFERQFFGDVMLFSMQQLVDEDLLKKPGYEQIRKIVANVQKEMLQKYREKQQATMDKVVILEELLYESSAWWSRAPALELARSRFDAFITNIKNNFSDTAEGFELINDEDHRNNRYQEIVKALQSYVNDRADWERLIS